MVDSNLDLVLLVLAGLLTAMWLAHLVEFRTKASRGNAATLSFIPLYLVAALLIFALWK